MLPSYTHLRACLAAVLEDKQRQGHAVDGLHEELARLPDDYQALYAFAVRLSEIPLRQDWPYVEPHCLEDILVECDPARPRGPLGRLSAQEAAARVSGAFLAAVCGCILGKPLEIEPTLEEIRAALQPLGEWPLRDYVTERAAHNFSRPPHPDWPLTVRERIRFVAPDDDINYMILGMLVLEHYGAAFDRKDVMRLWMTHLPPGFTWGPERVLLTKAALASLLVDQLDEHDAQFETWVGVLNPGDERCGAMIRAHAYGYACPGHPELASRLAWQDARLTHRRTGLYGCMFAAAAIATAFVERDRLTIIETALQFVPQRSRFYAAAKRALSDVGAAADWLDGYRRIQQRWPTATHCQIYQETATLINTLRFADDIGDGLCKQVMQGNDTDSYAALAGSLLGALFGPDALDRRWITPFNDEIRTKLAGFPERSLARLAQRMGQLPQRLGQVRASSAPAMAAGPDRWVDDAANGDERP